MLPGNASSLEVTWTTIAIGGAGFATALAGNVWLSHQTVVEWIRKGRIRRWGPRHKFVLGFFVGVALLLLVWCGFVLLGANAIANPPPSDPGREAASERGGWILVILEGALFLFQAILMWAWWAVGRPTLAPDSGPTTLAALTLDMIDAGREMGHAVTNDLQLPVAILDEIALDPTVSEERRNEAAQALVALDRLLKHVHSLHTAIKAREGAL
jgi:hypothetical protein